MTWQIIHADCLEAMAEMDEASVDAIVTDPPYGLGFMGKAWDADFEPADMPMRRNGPQDAVNAGAARQGGRQRRGPDFQKRMARDSRKYQDWTVGWATAALRVLKPGGHLLAFGGTRTYHRLACAVEDAGFEIRDCLAWLYGSGFPKSLNLNGAWQGWGTALKPSHEPIVLARKPLVGSVAQNVQTYGTGALNIDGTRIDFQGAADKASAVPGGRLTAKSGALAGGTENDAVRTEFSTEQGAGRWPANVVLDPEAAALLDEQTGDVSYNPAGAFGTAKRNAGTIYGGGDGLPHEGQDVFGYGDTGGASRFFRVIGREEPPYGYCDCGHAGPEHEPTWTGEDVAYPCAVCSCRGYRVTRFRYVPKADREERDRGLEHRRVIRKGSNFGNDGPRPHTAEDYHYEADTRNPHPTVKPVELMRWLCRLVTPPGGLILDPFTGSGSTGIAALREGFDFVGIEREADYVEIARDRIIGDAPMFNVPAEVGGTTP